MTGPFSDELISAYLDGELTAQEQARVEQELRENAELRRMCDELRALRFTLQSMPVAQPTHDLTDQVLRQAERRLLSGPEEPGKLDQTNPVATADRDQRGGGVSGPPLLRSWRFFSGVAAALAALLLLALWIPVQSYRHRELAASRSPADDTVPQQRRAAPPEPAAGSASEDRGMVKRGQQGWRGKSPRDGSCTGSRSGR